MTVLKLSKYTLRCVTMPDASAEVLNETESRLSDQEVDALYQRARKKFEDVAYRAKVVSTGTGGLRAETSRHYWASILFTRLVVNAQSILRLCPKTSPTPDRHAHWDFSSVASLTRNLLECYFVFYYMCVDRAASDDEWQTRQEAMFLHDNTTRRRMFRDLDPNHPDLAGFDGHRVDLTERLQGRPYFQSLEKEKKEKILSGKGYPFKQDELLDRMGIDRNALRFYYRFLSAHTHSDPVAFYRMAEHGRGAGVENSVDKAYIAASLETANSFLTRAIGEILLDFPDAEERGAQVLGNRATRRARHKVDRRSRRR